MPSNTLPHSAPAAAVEPLPPADARLPAPPVDAPAALANDLLAASAVIERTSRETLARTDALLQGFGRAVDRFARQSRHETLSALLLVSLAAAAGAVVAQGALPLIMAAPAWRLCWSPAIRRSAAARRGSSGSWWWPPPRPGQLGWRTAIGAGGRRCGRARTARRGGERRRGSRGAAG